jgi:hypothetical protein
MLGRHASRHSIVDARMNFSAQVVHQAVKSAEGRQIYRGACNVPSASLAGSNARFSCCASFPTSSSRRIIRAETTKIETYNEFLDWICFGGPVVKSGDPVEQEKQLKYASLVANAVMMLSNVVDLSEVLSVMAKEGQPVTADLAARISPYVRDHIRRFGRFALDMTELPNPLDPQL